MNRPQRRKAALWQRDIEKSAKADLDEADKPLSGHKPHIYYW